MSKSTPLIDQLIDLHQLQPRYQHPAADLHSKPPQWLQSGHERDAPTLRPRGANGGGGASDAQTGDGGVDGGCDDSTAAAD